MKKFMKAVFKTIKASFIDVLIIITIVVNDYEVSPILYVYLMTPLVIKALLHSVNH